MKDLKDILAESILADDEELDNRKVLPKVIFTDEEQDIKYLQGFGLTLKVFEEFVGYIIYNYKFDDGILNTIWEVADNVIDGGLNYDESPWFIDIYFDENEQKKHKPAQLGIFYDYRKEEFRLGSNTGNPYMKEMTKDEEKICNQVCSAFAKIHRTQNFTSIKEIKKLCKKYKDIDNPNI